MAIQKFNEYIKQQDESKKTIGIQKFSDYAKDNNLSYKINKFKPNAGKDTNKWFKKGAFEDGYQKGDAILTTLGTVADFGTNVLRGAGSLVEGVTDLGTYALAGVSSVLGEKEIASKLKETASKSWVDNAVSSLELDGELDNYSILGDKSDSISQGIGQIGTMMLTGGIGASAGLGTAGTTALTTSLIGTSGMGSGMNEAYQNGATDGEAVVYGLINGAADAGTELIFGGLGKAVNAVGLSKGLTSADDMLAKTISNKFKSQLAKNLTEYTVKSLAEGSEELMAGVIQSIGKKLTYMSEKELSTIIKDEKLLDQFITGSITSAIAQAPSLVRITSQGGEYIENTDTKKKGEISNEKDINKNEISTSDKQILINQISEISNQLEEYQTLQKQNKLTKEQQQQMANLEKQLNVLQKKVDNKNNFVEEKINMPTVNDIVAQEQKKSNTILPSVKTNSDAVNLSTVNDLVKNSINTSSNSNQLLPARNLTFEESASRYNIDTNNDAIRSISKLMSNRGIVARFDSNLFNDTNTNAVWVPITNKNGEITGREVVFNPNADTNQLLQDVAVHEIYHDIVSSGNGNVLNDLIQSFNMNIDGFEKARQELAEMYAKKYPNLGKNSTEFQQLIDEEVAASILGKKLGSQEYINRLVHEKPSIAKRIYDFVIDKLNQLNRFVGYKSEKIFWEDVKNKFEKAYREEYENNKSTSVDSKYMITGIKGTENAINIDSDNQWILDSYNKAKKMASQNYSNEEIRQKTWWFQDENRDWKFEISDAEAKIISKLEKNKDYRLGDILEHNDLYEMYPKSKKIKVKFKNIDSYVDEKGKIHKKNGRFNKITNTFEINNALLLKGNDAVLNTLIHEIQHYVQKIEKFTNGTSINNGEKQYYNNFGEKEARDTSARRKLTEQQRKKIAPASSIVSEHSTKKIDKKGYSMYNNDIEVSNSESNQENNQIFQEGIRNNSLYRLNKGDSNEIYEENNNENKENDLQINDSMGRISGGRELIENEGLDNSSFSFKQKQLDIILENNPVNDDYHTWIRNVDDIKTFEEALEDTDYKEYYDAGEDFDETYSADMAKEALSTGKITVYSSYPIEQGIFVSPSRMEAESYSGNGKVYSKEVNLVDVAWIDPTQGQYAKVSDTKYSQSSSNWQDFLEKNYKSEGTGQTLQDIKLPTRKDVSKINMPPVENKKIMNPNEISKMTKEDANTTPILPTIKVSTGDGESKFTSNIRNKTDMLSESSKDAILSNDDVKFYEKVTNKESLEKAYERLNKNGRNEVMDWLSKDSTKADSTDVAEGWILLKQYQDIIGKETDLIKKDELNRSMVQVAKKMREIGTKAGQTVQAFNILNRLTPEGMVYYAQSELSEAFEVMSKNKTKEWIDNNRDKFELTPEETQFIMDTMQEVQHMEDGYDKRVKLAEIQKVMTDKLPPSKGAGIKAWMRISMLFNPKTQVRNVMGNAIIAPVNTFSDLFANIVDKQIAKKTGVRTTGKTNLKNYAKGFKKGAFESYNDFKKGINTRNIQGNRFEVTEGKSFNDNTSIGKVLNRVDSLLSFMLDAGDRTFYEATFTNSINNQLILNNTDVVTQEMIDIATSEALSRTWQDNNNYTKFVLSVRNMLNNINVKGYGLGDVLIPFAKTPANLTKAIIDYSPAGLIKTMVEGNNLRKALTNGQYTVQMQHQFVQDLGKATAGTMLYVLGYALAKAGVVSGESDDDKDVSNFMKNTLGVNSYSIKIGDKSFTYDWAQPIAAPLSIMANYVNKTKENPNASNLENLVSSLDVAGNIILEQSFMESINTVLSNNEGIATGIQEAILDLPSRAVPTLMKQIADLVDPVQRTSFEYDKPLESAINSIKAKIPFVSKTLAPSVDTMGKEIQKYGGKNNIFNVFLNPANVNTENISKSAEEIYRLYKSTGETNIMPRVAPYYVNQDGEKITLNSKQRAEYQKISGEIIENNVEKLLETSEYNNMSDKEKAEVIKNIVNYSYNIAQKEILNIELSNTYQKAYEYSQIGDISDFYTFKASIDDTNKDTKKESITNYLINCILEDNQIAVLYGSYYSSEAVLNSLINANIPIKEFIKFNSQEFTTDYYDNGKAITNSRKNKVINYINSLNLTIPQKAMLIKLEYSSYTGYDSQIVNYINNMKYSKFEKASLLKSFGFDNYDKYLIDYVNNMNKTKEEKIEILEEMGFTIRNGKVYS